jgi:NAD(P)-dependent dehydrogenase (short-subunit alcohol dehydrogenase family)
MYEGTSMGSRASYAASKGGLLQLTRWLATVMAPKVRVNMITLGGVWSNQPESFSSQYTSRTPLGRMAVEEDIKGSVAYLASDLSAYVTGQNLIIDGGYTVW